MGPCTKNQEIAKLFQLVGVLREDGYEYLASILTDATPSIERAIKDDHGCLSRSLDQQIADARAELARVAAQVDEAKQAAAKARLENETRAVRFATATFLLNQAAQTFHATVKAI